MAATQVSKIELPPEPPPRPRQATAAARRRSLMEPRVRFWWTATIVLIAAGAYFLVTQTMEWMEELKIVHQGTPVTATVLKVGEGEVEGVGNQPPYSHVMLEFHFNDQVYDVDGYLEGRKEPISPKQAVAIKVDPADARRWTYLTEAPPLLSAYMSTLILSPFVIAAGIVSWLLRRRVLRIWTTGDANPYMVAAMGQSAFAPGSMALRCRPLEGKDQRIVSVFVPRRFGNFKIGDVLWLVHPRGNPPAAVAAMTYEEKSC